MNNSISTKSARQGFVFGAGGGLLAGGLAAVLWAYVSVLSGWQIGYLAIGVGFCVAFGARVTGYGNTAAFQIMAAAIAVIACFVGNMLVEVGYYAQDQQVNWLISLAQFTPFELLDYTIGGTSPIDILFYALAAGAGFKYSLEEADGAELPAFLTKIPALPLVIAGYTLLFGFLAALFIGYRVPVTYYHENGERASDGYYKKGHRVGEWRYYNTKGQMVQTGFQTASVSTGSWKWLGDSSEVQRIVAYAYGLEHGLAQYFYANGQVQDSGSYYFGRMHGQWVGYYQDGTRRAKGWYVAGNRVGNWEFYHPNGALEARVSYVDDEVDGYFESFYSNGLPAMRLVYGNQSTKIIDVNDSTGRALVVKGQGNYRDVQTDWLDYGSGLVKDSLPVGSWLYNWPLDWKSEGTYVNGRYHYMRLWKGAEVLVSGGKGVFKEYASDSSLHAEGPIVDGKKEGLWKKYYPDGKVQGLKNYKNGKYHGIVVDFSSNGDTTYRAQFTHGKLQGDVFWAYETGGIETQARFVDDIKTGEQLFYDDWGNLVKTETYEAGRLTKIYLPYAPTGKRTPKLPEKTL